MADLMIQFDSGRIYEHAEEIATMLRQQHAEIEALKQIIDANNLNQNIGQFVKPDLKIEEVMSEHCTCYKLSYNPLNDYRKVETKWKLLKECTAQYLAHPAR